jgi:DNA-binding transcriptional ArsR family regulator
VITILAICGFLPSTRLPYATYTFNNGYVDLVAVDSLSHTFAALADPTRRAILDRLAEGEATVNELAEPFPITVQAVSRHLKVLEQAGLIVRGREGQRRPSRLDGEALRAAAAWLEHYERFWTAGFDRMGERLDG